MPAPRTVFLGVDTGGTFTDAVVYDDAAGTVLATAKAPTTHDDLAVGIEAALDRAIDAAAVDPAHVGLVSLSTTLATNALVEGGGRPACLVMIGFETDALDRAGLRDAVGTDRVVWIAGGHTPHGTPQAALDLDALDGALTSLPGDVEGFAVTAQFAVRNPEHELAARDFIRDRTGLPVTCSHELSDGLNGPKRSVTALLNARLIGLIEGLVATTEGLLARRGIDAPIMVVRGNGSLVSAAFVRERPVETILSGPAASLVGAAHLVGAADAVVADIGGTTTDIAVVRDGEPAHGDDGAMVGGHRTMVEAVRMHTHGLGGDSEVHLADRAVGADLRIGPRRVVPVSVCAETAGELVGSTITRLLESDVPPTEWAGSFVSATARADSAVLDGNDARLLDEVGEGWAAADLLATTNLRTRTLRRLAQRGLVRVSGFTPTDAGHVLGTHSAHDADAARAAATLFARRSDRNGAPVASGPEALAAVVVDTFVRRAAEALLAAALDRDGLPVDAVESALVDAALDGTATSTRLDIGLAVPLVVLGAPATSFGPAIGERLGARVEVPTHAEVANAVGAVVGRVRIRRSVTVTAPKRGIYRVHAGAHPDTVHDLDEARLAATAAARATVEREMAAAGAADFVIDERWHETSAVVEGREMFVEGVAVVVGQGRPLVER